MNIQKHCVVTLRYCMENSRGVILENIMDGPGVSYLHGEGKILSGLENQLLGMEIGETKQIWLKKEAYQQLDDDFHVKLVIDHIRPASSEEIMHGVALQRVDDNTCNDDCLCYKSPK